jgi:flagellar basal-body rod protein FlgG
MTAQQLNVDVIAHNLANVNTTGFKRSRADFQDILYQTLRQPGAASSNETEIPTGIQLGLGARPAAVQKLFLQGDTQRIVNSDGYPLEPEITIPNDATNITVGADGVVSVLRPGQANPQQVGQLQLVTFANPAGLSALGRSLFQTTTASGDPIEGVAGEEGLGTLSQGFLEVSNVSVVEEMVNLITGQRAYEINSRAIQAADEMLQTAANLRR